MQAFYLRTSIGEPTCAQAPSALVVQGPENLHVNIEANGADITLGSTIILRSYTLEEADRAGLNLIGSPDAGGLLEITVIDGRATVRQQDGTLLIINEGEQSFICLNKPGNLGVDGLTNDQTITYACGGWTAPAPIPQSVRSEFGLVDDYPLIYPIDIVTPTPTVAPAVSTQTPSATPITSASALTISARLSLNPATSAMLTSFAGAGFQGTSFVYDASVSVTNTGGQPASGRCGERHCARGRQCGRAGEHGQLRQFKRFLDHRNPASRRAGESAIDRAADSGLRRGY